MSETVVKVGEVFSQASSHLLWDLVYETTDVVDGPLQKKFQMWCPLTSTFLFSFILFFHISVNTAIGPQYQF